MRIITSPNFADIRASDWLTCALGVSRVAATGDYGDYLDNCVAPVQPAQKHWLTARMRSSYEYMNYLQVVQDFVRTPVVNIQSARTFLGLGSLACHTIMCNTSYAGLDDMAGRVFLWRSTTRGALSGVTMNSINFLCQKWLGVFAGLALFEAGMDASATGLTFTSWGA